MRNHDSKFGRHSQREQARAALTFGPLDIGFVVVPDNGLPFVLLPEEFEQQLPGPKSPERYQLSAVVAQMARGLDAPAGATRVDYAGGRAFRFTTNTINNAEGRAAA